MTALSLAAAAFFIGLAVGSAVGLWALLHVDNASSKG